MLDVLPREAGRSGTLIVNSAGTVFGLDGSTGIPLWRCDGPGRVLGIIAPGDNEHPARIAFTDDSSVVLEDALPTTADGRYDVE